MYLPEAGDYTITVSEITTSSCKITLTKKTTPVTHTYSIAGNDAEVFGASWSTSETSTEMTETASGSGIYTWTKNNVVYPENNLEFKIIEDHTTYKAPSDNYVITDLLPYNTYNLTITYNANTDAVSHSYTLVSAATEAYYLVGDMNSWAKRDANYAFTNNNGTWTLATTNFSGEFKIIDQNLQYYASGTAFTKNNSTNVTVTTSGNNMSIADAGNYTFTLNVGASSKSLTITGWPIDPLYLRHWTGNKIEDGSAVAMTTSDGVHYTVSDVTLASGEYVVFSTVNAGEWNSGTQWNCGESDDKTFTSGIEETASTSGSKAYKAPVAGTWSFTFDTNNGKWTPTLTTNRDTGKMYIIGNANAGVWQANHGVEMTETETGSGIFVADNVQLMSGSDFSFTSKLGINDTDWATVNLYRYYADSDQTCEVFDNMVGNYAATPPTNGVEFSLKDTGDGSGNTNNFKMKTSGSYRITLNTNTHKVMFQQMYLDLYMFGKGFHWGNQTPSEWNPTSDGAIQMTTTDGKIYHLDAVTFDDATDVGFIFSKVVADNPDDGGRQYVAKNGFFPSNSDSYDICKNDTQNDINKQLTMVAGSTDDTKALANFNEHRWFVWGEAARSGKYNVVVDIENMTVMLKENITINNEMYIRLEQTDNVKQPGVKVWIEGGTITKLNGEWANGAEGSHMTGETNPGNVTSQGKTYWLDGKTWFKCREYTSYDNRKWWEWEIGGDQFRIASITFYRNGDENDNPDDPNGDLNRRSGVLYYTWPNTDDIEDHTADYYIDHVKEAPDCATMIDDHYYVYFVNTPGWSTVYCHAWNSNNEALLPDAGNGTASGSWPGDQCMVVGYTDDGFAVYRYDFGLKSYWQNMDVAGIIFNSGENEQGVVGEQTGDFPFKNGGVFDYVGRVSLGRSLGTIIAKGVVNGPLYEVEDELTIVYYDPYESGSYTVPIYEDGEQVGTTTTNYTGAFYAKDNNTANSKSLNTSGKRDYVFDVTHFTAEKDWIDSNGKTHLAGSKGELLMQGKVRYDQSNWVKLVRANDYASNSTNANWNAATLVGKKIAGDNLGGQLVDNLNPTMIVETLPANALSAASYSKNEYIMPHFNDNYTVNGGGKDDCDFFFVRPKANEVATITWAVYTEKDNDGNYQFYVPRTVVPLAENQNFANGMFVHGNNYGLQGAINVKSWDLATVKENGEVKSNPNMETLLQSGEAYTFDAIIRYKETPTGGSSGAPAINRLKEVQVNDGFNPNSSQFEIYPIAIDVQKGIVTAIKDVKNDAAKTIKSVKVYDTMGVERREMQGGVNIVVTTYSDGTRSVQKILK